MLQETQRFHPSYSTILNIPQIDTRTGSRHLTFTCTVCSLSWRCRFLGIGSLLTEGRLPPNLSLICCNDRVIFGELRLVGIILSLCSQTMLTVDIKLSSQRVRSESYGPCSYFTVTVYHQFSEGLMRAG